MSRPFCGPTTGQQKLPRPASRTGAFACTCYVRVRLAGGSSRTRSRPPPGLAGSRHARAAAADGGAGTLEGAAPALPHEAGLDRGALCTVCCAPLLSALERCATAAYGAGHCSACLNTNHVHIMQSEVKLAHVANCATSYGPGSVNGVHGLHACADRARVAESPAEGPGAVGVELARPPLCVHCGPNHDQRRCCIWRCVHTCVPCRLCLCLF